MILGKDAVSNNGDGTFTDVTVQTGTLAYGAGMSATIGDYDNDGRSTCTSPTSGRRRRGLPSGLRCSAT
jgi:hypothetical protein